MPSAIQVTALHGRPHLPSSIWIDQDRFRPLYDWDVPTRLHPSQAIALIDDTVTFMATEQLKLLLETKHLYQRVSIDPTERIAALCADFVYTDQPSRVSKYLAELATVTFALGSGKAVTIPGDGSIGQEISSPAIGFVNVKMFCSACKSREAFAPTWMRDIDWSARSFVPLDELV